MNSSTNDPTFSPVEKASFLLSQQIWCWGQDIEHEGGNLLTRFGFERVEKPAESSASSIYQLDISSEAQVILRGFGVYCGDPRFGGLFLRRYEFAPKLTARADLEKLPWQPEDLPSLRSPKSDDEKYRCKQLLITLADWIRQYEAWIGLNVGLAWRKHSLLKWKPDGELVFPGEKMAVEWRMLGVKIADAPNSFFCG